MSVSEDVLGRLTSLSIEAVPYKTFLSDLSKTIPKLQTLQSLSSGLESDNDRAVVISTFSLMLSALKVPSSCTLIGPKLPLGHGAQFHVVKQRVTGLTQSATSVPTSLNNVRIAAVKTPRFLLDGQQKLDLSNPEVSRQVRNMIMEIAALCHPSLRDHRNIVDLWGWGTGDETGLRVPFLILEEATNTLATFLCESKSAPIALKHHLALDIGCGLDALHDIGLIHGDLKPENVLMFYKAAHWVAKLADFSGGADVGQGGSGRLEGGGTVGWRAPELRHFFDDGTQIDELLLDKMDSYSYGLLLWSMFLKENGSAPCAENVEAEMVALSELKTDRMSLPISLQSVLKSSFSLLLKQDPMMRTRKVGHLLDDGSRTYSEWYVYTLSPCQRTGRFIHLRVLFKGSRSETSPEDGAAVALPQGNDVGYNLEVPGDDILYHWEVPEIGMGTVVAVQSAFLRNETMAPEMIQSLFMKCAGFEELVIGEDSGVRDLILDLLYTGSKQESFTLRALIYIVHEHFQVVPRADICKSKLDWMSESVASGAFFLRKSLQHLDNGLFERSIQTFQYDGGYNQFYADLDRDTIPEILMRLSKDVHFNWDISLNQRGDKLLHILSSTTAARKLGNIVEFMSPQEVNALNDCGETALYRACMAGATANVLLLLSHGADPSIAPSHGTPTCLHWLFHFSSKEVDLIAIALVKHGAPIHALSEWELPMFHYPFVLPLGTPLHWAVANSAVEAVRSLLDQGADPSVRDGSDPYAYDDNVRVLDMQHPLDGKLCSFAKHTTLGFNALDLAVKNRDHEVLAILLSKSGSFDPGDTDEEGYSVVHRLDAGEWLYTTQGSTLWSRLFQGSTVHQADSLKKTIAVLLQHGLKLNGLTKQRGHLESGLGFSGQTALMIAVAKGHIETVKQLLDAGADVNVANDKGETALMSLRDLSFGDIGQQVKIRTELVSLLLDANANVHARTSSGMTPFLHAASGGHFEVATALLNHGADLRDRVTEKTLRLGQTAFAIIISDTRLSTAKIDDWLVAQLNTHILPRIAAPGGSALHNGLLENADLDGGTLLHYAARVGLIRSCMVLLEANVSINKIQRFESKRRLRPVTCYSTALDEALDERGMSRSYIRSSGSIELEQSMLQYSVTFRKEAPFLSPFLCP